MESVSYLQGRLATINRAARNIVADGGTYPNPAQRAAYDALMDEAERTEAAIGLQNAGRHETTAMRWAREHVALDAFLRTGDAGRLRNITTTTTGAWGGYLVPTLVAGDIMGSLAGYGWMRQVATVLPTVNGAPLGYPHSDGQTEQGERVDQNAIVGSADPTFTTASLATTKYSSKIITLPFELLQDGGVDVVDFVSQRIVERIGRIQNADFTTGTGTNQPTGLLTAATLGKVAATGQTVTVLYDDLVDMTDSVGQASLGMPNKSPGKVDTFRSGWMFSQTTRKMIRRIKDSSGRPVWLPSGRAGELPQLLDYPVYINNDMPVPAANAKTIAFGALGRYVIRDSLDIQIFRLDGSAYVKAGQVGFLGILRSGGNLVDPAAVIYFQQSAT